MQLNLETDYGIRSMLYLAEKEESISSSEMARELGFHTVEHAQKILRKLRDAKLVTVKLGAAGGYHLAKEPSQITVKEVLLCMEETICINRCLEPDGYCSRNGVPHCAMHKFYLKVQKSLEDAFDAVTLQDILDENF